MQLRCVEGDSCRKGSGGGPEAGETWSVASTGEARGPGRGGRRRSDPRPLEASFYAPAIRVALVHECIAGWHGSERVLGALAALWPEAPVFCTAVDPAVIAASPLAHRDVRTSFVQRLPGLGRVPGRHRLTLPLWPLAVEQHDLRGFDVVISSHHAAAHGVLTRADQTHVSYTHSPARYAWDLYPEHVDPARRAPLKRALLSRFRRWDVAAAQRVDHFLANSATVARRIAKTYRREATVIHPPVEVARFAAAARPAGERSGFVWVGRLVPYKNAGPVVEAFRRSGRELTVLGDGPERERLQAAAGPGTRFVQDADDRAVAKALGAARALVFSAEEDFGMVPVEALAAGTPVIALGRGGAAETVDDGETGLFFGEPTPDAIEAAVERFEADGVRGGAEAFARAADRCAPERFSAAVRGFVEAARERDLSQGPPTRERP